MVEVFLFFRLLRSNEYLSQDYHLGLNSKSQSYERNTLYVLGISGSNEDDHHTEYENVVNITYIMWVNT